MTVSAHDRPRADRSFLDVFMPYEVRLAQRRAMVQGTGEGISGRCFLGLYLVHVEATSADAAVEVGTWGPLHHHLAGLVAKAMRDSDIPCFLGNGEHFVVARDLDAENAFVIAQRLLRSVNRSTVVAAKAVRVSVGYVVYPLSTQPNLPAAEWPILLDLTRALAARYRGRARTSGCGLVQGPEVKSSGMAETVLIPVALDDPEPMIEAGALALQKVEVMAASGGPSGRVLIS